MAYRQPVASTSRTRPAPTPQGTLADVHRLIKYTVRAFYGSQQAILMDQMLHAEAEPAIKEDVLWAKLGVQSSELNKMAARLIKDRLLAVHRRNEVKENREKASSVAWYWLDLKTIVDVIKWRVYKVRKILDDKSRSEVRSQGYSCPLCKKPFSTLDVAHLVVDSETFMFRCDVCDSILEDNESTQQAELEKTKVRRYLDQTKVITDALKRTETFVVPEFAVDKWLETNHPLPDSAALPRVGPDGIRISTGGAQSAKLHIELADEASVLAARLAKAQEAEAARAQNALPTWIERSTISGGLTIAGAKQAAADAVEAAKASFHAPLSPVKEPGDGDEDDTALLEYYAQQAAPVSKAEGSPEPADARGAAARDRSRSSSSSGDDEGDDDLFEAVGLSHSGVLTPPTSYEEDKPLGKPKNENGKRSRDASEDGGEPGDEDFGDFGDFDVVPPKKVKLEDAAAPSAAPSPALLDEADAGEDSEEEDFEAVA